jgi:hypothetical protein
MEYYLHRAVALLVVPDHKMGEYGWGCLYDIPTLFVRKQYRDEAFKLFLKSMGAWVKAFIVKSNFLLNGINVAEQKVGKY